MNTWDTNTEWFVVKCDNRNKIIEHLKITGEIVDWPKGIDNFIGSENLVISNSLDDYIVLGGSNVMDLAFDDVDQYMSFDAHEGRLRHMTIFLNELSLKFDEAYFFQTHDHHVINFGLFKSIMGNLIYGKAVVDAEQYVFMEDKSTELNFEEIFEVIEKWTFSPLKIETEFDISKLNWIEIEHKSLMSQVMAKMMGK